MIADDVVEHLKTVRSCNGRSCEAGIINLQVKEEFLADYLKKWQQMRNIL